MGYYYTNLVLNIMLRNERNLLAKHVPFLFIYLLLHTRIQYSYILEIQEQADLNTFIYNPSVLFSGERYVFSN
jgi:hypothetical protein